MDDSIILIEDSPQSKRQKPDAGPAIIEQSNTKKVKRKPRKKKSGASKGIYSMNSYDELLNKVATRTEAELNKNIGDEVAQVTPATENKEESSCKIVPNDIPAPQVSLASVARRVEISDDESDDATVDLERNDVQFIRPTKKPWQERIMKIRSQLELDEDFPDEATPSPMRFSLPSTFEAKIHLPAADRTLVYSVTPDTLFSDLYAKLAVEMNAQEGGIKLCIGREDRRLPPTAVLCEKISSVLQAGKLVARRTVMQDEGEDNTGEELAAAAKAAAKAQDQAFLVFRDSAGNEDKYNIDKNSTFEKVFQLYKQKRSNNKNPKFFFDGEILQAKSSPVSADLDIGEDLVNLIDVS
eukprot:m.283000 g.283000  ORF g.283000 m.283000 type:complete len:354 (-) comp16338_c2_seq36:4053-5114(-)